MKQSGRNRPITAVGRFLLGALLLLAAIAPASSQEADFKRGPLGHLAPHIGTYQIEAVLADPAVAASIQRQMGPLDEQLRHNIRVGGPIDFIDGALVVSGQALHEEGEFEAASIWVHIFSGRVAVILLHEGTTTVYTEHRQQEFWSPLFRATVRNIGKIPGEIALPENLVWIHAGEARDPATAR